MRHTLEPESDYIILRVDEVDLDSRIAYCLDQTNNYIAAYWQYQPGGVTFVPQSGEIWRGYRQGYRWFLQNRLDVLPDDIAIGDAALSTTNNLYIQTKTLYINQRPLGTTVLDVFHKNTGYLSVKLSHKPISKEVIRPKLNGLDVVNTIWRFDEETNILSFIHEMGHGYLQVFYETWQQSSDDADMISATASVFGVDTYN